MAPIKFDEKIRDKLNKRTITPSEMAWEKLDDKLDGLKKKKNNKPFWILGLAASFAGVLLVSSLFFKINETTKPVIVKTKDKVEIKKEINSIVFEEEAKEKIVINKENQIQEKEEVEKNRVLIKGIQQQQKVAKGYKEEVVENRKRTIQGKSVISEELEVHSIAKVVALNGKNNTDNFETQKVNEVAAQIQELKANKNNISEAEIDALLNKAQKEIFKRRSETNSIRVVDANSLLFDVENELEQSFRERVFETIKSGYKTVRTAVVERKKN